MRKKVANVDRYGKNQPRAEAADEAGAEDASVYHSNEEASDVENMDPLLDDEHELPPDHWTLADGSPVFRTGKKSLRLEPRKNRKGNGEDSSEHEISSTHSKTKAHEEIVPVVSEVPAITAAHTPVAPRAKRTRAVPEAFAPPKATATDKTVTIATKSTPEKASTAATKTAFGSLHWLLLALLLIVAVLAGGLFVPRPTTTNIAFTGSGENFTTLNQLISDNSHFKETNARLTQLETKLSDVAAQLQKQIDQKSLEQMQELQKEKTALQAEIAKLKKDMSDELAKKIDAVQLSNSVRPMLDKEKSEVQQLVAKLEKRVAELESRPVPTTTAPTTPTTTGTEHSSAELAKLKKQLEELQTAVSSLSSVSEKLNALEAKLKQTILHTLETEESKKSIVNLINAHLTKGDKTKQAELSPDALNAIVDKVLASNKDIKTTSDALAAVHKTVAELQAEMTKLKQQQASPSGANTGSSAELLQRLQALETQVTQLKSAPHTPNTGNDGKVTELEKSIAAIKSDLEKLSTSQKGDNSALVAIDRRLKEVEAKASSAPAQNTDTSAVERRVLDTVRTEIVSEITRRVASATSGIGRPDHALFTTGARVLETATGWPSTVNWKGAGRFNFFGSSKPPQQHPSIALEPSLTPGLCWSFPGQEANFSVKVACPITPTHFTVDHIPRDEAVTPKSMPRHFTIYGFQSREWDVSKPKVTKLLSGEYKDNGPTAQTFAVDRSVVPQTFDAFTLAINTNYGEEYTCLYRFRVHGDRSPSCITSNVVTTAAASSPSTH